MSAVLIRYNVECTVVTSASNCSHALTLDFALTLPCFLSLTVYHDAKDHPKALRSTPGRLSASSTDGETSQCQWTASRRGSRGGLREAIDPPPGGSGRLRLHTSLSENVGDFASRRRPPFLTMSSQHSKPYMIPILRDERFQNHMGFAMVRAHGKEWWPPPRGKVTNVFEQRSTTFHTAYHVYGCCVRSL